MSAMLRVVAFVAEEHVNVVHIVECPCVVGEELEVDRTVADGLLGHVAAYIAIWP